MSTAVDCKRSLEIEIPVEEIEKARERVTEQIKSQVRLPGFRPGKAPLSMIQSRFAEKIKQDVLETVLPDAFRKKVSEAGLNVVGTPNVSDLKYEPGEPIRFKAEFEVAPEFELGEYRGLQAKYAEPVVTDEEVDKRLESLRESKADYANLDPRPIENGDFVVTHLKSIAGLAEPIDSEVQIEVGGEETMPGFNEALLGAEPGQIRQIDITYPENYARENLAGKTVTFELTPKTLRKKELPALDDEFARDLGDFQTLAELREQVKKSIYQEKQYTAQQAAKEELLDRLVETHEFAVPQAYVDNQIENQIRSQLREIAGAGVDPRQLNLDWEKIKETQKDRALRNVKASLLLGKICEREGIVATRDEVDREVGLIARREREAVPVTRAKLEKEGVLRNIADQIRTQKTLQFLFDNAQKIAE